MYWFIKRQVRCLLWEGTVFYSVKDPVGHQLFHDISSLASLPSTLSSGPSHCLLRLQATSFFVFQNSFVGTWALGMRSRNLLVCKQSTRCITTVVEFKSWQATDGRLPLGLNDNSRVGFRVNAQETQDVKNGSFTQLKLWTTCHLLDKNTSRHKDSGGARNTLSLSSH